MSDRKSGCDLSNGKRFYVAIVGLDIINETEGLGSSPESVLSPRPSKNLKAEA